MLRLNSTEDITYKDYTNTSSISGIGETSSKGDSLITIIKNGILTYDSFPAPENVSAETK